MRYFKKIIGETVFLSPLDANDYEKFTEWVNDTEVSQYLLLTGNVLTMDNEKHFLSNEAANEVRMAIVDKDTKNVIGICGLHRIDPINRSALFGIFLGDKNYHNKGIGTEATKLMLDFGFSILNLHSVYLEVFAYNKRAIRCYEKCGFKQMGVRRQFHYYAGSYHDALYFDILASEYESTYVKPLFEKSTNEGPHTSTLTIL